MEGNGDEEAKGLEACHPLDGARAFVAGRVLRRLCICTWRALVGLDAVLHVQLVALLCFAVLPWARSSLLVYLYAAGASALALLQRPPLALARRAVWR